MMLGALIGALVACAVLTFIAVDKMRDAETWKREAKGWERLAHRFINERDAALESWREAD